MYFYQTIPSLPNLYALRTSDSFAVQAVDDQWKLTDSSTFTNLRRADASVVRLNGADSTSALQQIAASDSLAVGLIDTFTGSQALSAIDSLTVQTSEASLISSSVSASDLTALQLSEAAAVMNAFGATEAILAGLTEGTPALSAVLTSSDSCATQASDVLNALTSATLASESAAIGLTDTFNGSQAISATENLAVQASDAVGIASSIGAQDSSAVQLSDVGMLSQVSAFTAETVAVQANDIANVIQNTLLSTSDSLAIGASEAAGLFQINALSVVDSCAMRMDETAAVLNAFAASESTACQLIDLFTGSQALSVSDAAMMQAFEDQLSSLPTAASDQVATFLSEAASVGATFASNDDLIVQLQDNGSKQDAESAIPKSAQDGCAIDVEEGALTELAGPYWSGIETDEHGLVYADSYAMGRREHPEMMRW